MAKKARPKKAKGGVRPRPRRGNPKVVRIPEAAQRELERLFLEGGITITDAASRVGVDRHTVARAFQRMAAEIARDEPPEDRFAQRWKAGRQHLLNGISRRAMAMRDELEQAREMRQAALGDDKLMGLALAWTNTIVTMEGRLMDLVREYAVTMAAVPPNVLLKLEIAGDIEEAQASELPEPLLKSKADSDSTAGDGGNERAGEKR